MPPKTGDRPRAAKKGHKEIRRRALLKKLPKGGRVVEIGVWRGDFSATILEILSPEQLLLVDPWHHIENAGQEDALAARAGREKMDLIFRSVQARFATEIHRGQVRVVRGFSDAVIPDLADGSVNVVYIDGDHSYEGARADLEAILPKMALKGVIACDDYHRRGWWKNGVIRAMNEFLGAHAAELRVLAIEGAQIAVQKLEPMD